MPHASTNRIACSSRIVVPATVLLLAVALSFAGCASSDSDNNNSSHDAHDGAASGDTDDSDANGEALKRCDIKMACPANPDNLIDFPSESECPRDLPAEGSGCESPLVRCYYCDTATYDETVETVRADWAYCSDDGEWVHSIQRDSDICV
jgi:hypothetical protein